MDLSKLKDAVAKIRGYESWDTLETFAPAVDLRMAKENVKDIIDSLREEEAVPEYSCTDCLKRSIDIEDGVIIDISLFAEDLKWGSIEIRTNYKDKEPLFWDNISFFLKSTREEIVEDCRHELEGKGIDVDSTVDIIIKEVKSLYDFVIEKGMG